MTKISFLTKEEVLSVVDSCDSARDKALFQSLFSSGLRIAELLNLTRDYFDKANINETLELSIVGKGNRQRVIYFSPQSLKSIKNYLEIRKDNNKKLFPISARRAQVIVKNRADRCGYKGITPHKLRHSFCTYILGETGNLRLCQEMLGHKNISTTQIYAHTTSRQLKDAHTKIFD